MYQCACICNLVDANATSIASQGKVKPGSRASSQYITCEYNKKENHFHAVKLYRTQF